MIFQNWMVILLRSYPSSSETITKHDNVSVMQGAETELQENVDYMKFQPVKTTI